MAKGASVSATQVEVTAPAAKPVVAKKLTALEMAGGGHPIHVDLSLISVVLDHGGDADVCGIVVHGVTFTVAYSVEEMIAIVERG